MERWESDLLERVEKLGFSSLNDYLRARPGAPYPALADELGASVLGVQVADLQLRKAKREGELPFREAARDALVRCLRQTLTAGWSRTESQDGASAEFMNIAAWSNWSSLVKRVTPADPRTDAVWKELETRAKEGWLPQDSEDGLVQLVFASAWPKR